MKMISTNNNMQITTLYHLSQQPIFPVTIYDGKCFTVIILIGLVVHFVDCNYLI